MCDFFFQAEDGIRDVAVTGVQTCALPILIPMATLAGILVVVAYSMSEWRTFLAEFRAPKSDVAVLLTTFLLTVLWDLTRSEERRVGKECRSRWRACA